MLWNTSTSHLTLSFQGPQWGTTGTEIKVHSAQNLLLLLLLFIAFIQRFSLLSSRLTGHVSHVIVNEWLDPFMARTINIHGSGVLVALCGCCMAGATWNAAVSAQVLCTPFNHVPGYSVTSFKATNGVCVFSCNLPPALLAEWPGSFTCYFGNTGVERIPK